MGEFDPGGASVTAAATRDTDPVPTDFGMVVRLIGAIPGYPIEGTLELGVTTNVTNAGAVIVLAANAARRGFLIQNNGTGNVRVGPLGVTVPTGVRLIPNAVLRGTPPFLPEQDLYAIAETVACDVLAVEIV